MKKFAEIVANYVSLPIANIDTDQIIPARFLKNSGLNGFGQYLFYDWCYKTDGTEITNFPLNNKPNNCKILVVGPNFGSGSSREHAVWALLDAGFRVVISSNFADIFKQNAYNNGLLPAQVSPDVLQMLLKWKPQPHALSIDLKEQRIKITNTLIQVYFEVDPYKKACLLKGQNDFDYLLNMKVEIERFEYKHHQRK